VRVENVWPMMTAGDGMDALMVDAAGVLQHNATTSSESSVSTNSSASDWGTVDPVLRLTGTICARRCLVGRCGPWR